MSHDLRTVLTRFKLELALLGDVPEAEAMKRDVDKLHKMAEALIKYETIDEGQIRDIMAGRDPRQPDDWEDRDAPTTGSRPREWREGDAPPGRPAPQH